MPNHLRKFSTYQKRMIKDLSNLLGDRPFSFDKTNCNHLQVKIQGVERVFHTGSTPSDYKSGKNFIGDIKAELRRLAQPPLTPAKPVTTHLGLGQPRSRSPKDQLQKITNTLIKFIRINFSQIKEKELTMLFEQSKPDAAQIAQFRHDFVENEFAKALKEKKDKDYFTKSLIKEGKDKVLEHLNFMLPTPAYYHEELKKRLSAHLDNKTLPNAEETTSEEKSAPLEASTPTKPTPVVMLTEEASQETRLPPPLTDLMKEKNHKRIRLLKTLPKHHLLLLLDDVKQALDQKHQEDIRHLLQLMQDKGIGLTELQQALEQQ